MNGASRPYHKWRLRFLAPVEAEVRCGGKAIVSQSLSDLGLEGVYIHALETPPAGSSCGVTLYLGGRASGQTVRASGHVEFADDEGFAIRFDNIQGADSYEHLCNLTLFNSANIDRLAPREKAAGV